MPAAKRVARDVQRDIKELIADGSFPPVLDTGQFYVDVLRRQLRCWSRTSPVSVAAIERVMTRFLSTGRDAEPTDRIEQLIEQHGGGLYSTDLLRSHIDTFGALFALGARTQSRRACSGLPSLRRRSGTSFAVLGERLAAEYLEQIGKSLLQESLESGRLSRRLGQAVYVEQAHLSRRFVEILTPMMSAQLRPDLRDLLYQYFSEEVGHEVFERAAAADVGVTADELSRSLQLPLFAAYIDVLTDIAVTNPIGLLMCIVVAEGFPGTSTPINEALEESGLIPKDESVRHHEALNLELHHSTVYRLMLGAVPTVSPIVQRAALRDLALAVELNVRGWNMFHSYYSNGSLPFPYSGTCRNNLNVSVFS